MRVPLWPIETYRSTLDSRVCFEVLMNIFLIFVVPAFSSPHIPNIRCVALALILV